MKGKYRLRAQGLDGEELAMEQYELVLVGGELDGITIARYDSEQLAKEAAKALDDLIINETDRADILAETVAIIDPAGGVVCNW